MSLPGPKWWLLVVPLTIRGDTFVTRSLSRPNVFVTAKSPSSFKMISWSWLLKYMVLHLQDHTDLGSEFLWWRWVTYIFQLIFFNGNWFCAKKSSKVGIFLLATIFFFEPEKSSKIVTLNFLSDLGSITK